MLTRRGGQELDLRMRLDAIVADNLGATEWVLSGRSERRASHADLADDGGDAQRETKQRQALHPSLCAAF